MRRKTDVRHLRIGSMLLIRNEGDDSNRQDRGGRPGRREAAGQGVFERRIAFGPGYRLYFGRDDKKLAVLLTGGTKKRRSKDMEQARAFWADCKRRKKGG